MQITIPRLMAGKACSIKDVEYLSTAEYVTPFVEELSRFGAKFIVDVEVPNQLTRTGGEKDITYNKVLIQAILPEKYNVEDWCETYCLAYALDVKKPIYKVYRAYRHMTSGVLMVFNSNWLICKELKPGQIPQYSLRELMEAYNDVPIKMKEMNEETYAPDIAKKQAMLGQLIDRALVYDIKNISGKVKVSAAQVVKAYESIYNDPASCYYTVDGSYDKLSYYEAIGNVVTKDDKDIINRFEKSQLVGMLLDMV